MKTKHLNTTIVYPCFMGKFTTIKIRNDLRDRLLALKIHPKESYSDVISKILDVYEV